MVSTRKTKKQKEEEQVEVVTIEPLIKEDLPPPVVKNNTKQFFQVVSQVEVKQDERMELLFTHDKFGHLCMSANCFKGEVYAHLRYYVPTPATNQSGAMDLKPTSRGITFNRKQFGIFLDNIPKMKRMWDEVDELNDESTPSKRQKGGGKRKTTPKKKVDSIKISV